VAAHDESRAGVATQAPASEVKPPSVQPIAMHALPIGAQRPQLSLQQYWFPVQTFFPQETAPPAPPEAARPP